MAQKNVSTGYQYPYPPEPSNWGQQERQFSQGLRRLFDILFSKKLQNVLIADNAVDGRTIAKESIALRHLVSGFGKSLDISENTAVESAVTAAAAAQSTADDAVTAAAAAQSTADGAVTAAGVAQSTADTAVSAVSALPGNLFPVGTIVMMDSAPSFGSWESFELGIQDVTAWKRVG